MERELDRLAEGQAPVRRLPRDLNELWGEIRESADVRRDCDPEEPPYPFDRFEVFEVKLGGMGMVLDARDPKLGRRVAIKLWCKSGPEANTALLNEAQTLAKLSHPNVVVVHETGRWNDRIFFVMEWIDGADGHEWLKTPRTWTEIRDVFVEAGKGLAAAHDMGIQHRDFKPANMLIGERGRVVVADFGVAASLDEADGADGGGIVGTPCYMAPERLAGGRGDARSDQYSFCAAIWRALYETRPYAGETREELLAAMRRHELRIGRRRRHVPRWLEQVVRKGLALEPGERHADMHALVRALLAGPEGDDERSDSEFGEAVLERNRGWFNAPRGESESRWRWIGFGYGVVSTVMVVLLGVGLFGGDRQRATETSPRLVEVVDQDGPLADPLVEEVIELVRQGKVYEADRIWLDERERRHSAGKTTGEETTRIGAALLARAREVARQNQSDEASALADMAARYGVMAMRELEDHDQSTAAVGALLEEIEDFYGRVNSP